MPRRGHYVFPDGSNYLPAGRLYKNVGFIGAQELYAGTFRAFTLVISNPTSIVHTFNNFYLQIGGQTSSLQVSPLTLQPGAQGILLNQASITLPAAGAYQASIIGDIDGDSFQLDNIGSIVVLAAPATSSLLMGNVALPATGYWPSGHDSPDYQHAFYVFVLNKYIALRTGTITSMKFYVAKSPVIYVQGSPTTYGGNAFMAFYPDVNGNPGNTPLWQIGNPIGMNSWINCIDPSLVSNQNCVDNWVSVPGVNFPVIAGQAWWIGIVATYGESQDCLGKIAQGGECYNFQYDWGNWQYFGNLDPNNGYQYDWDLNRGNWKHDNSNAMIACYGL